MFLTGTCHFFSVVNSEWAPEKLHFIPKRYKYISLLLVRHISAAKRLTVLVYFVRPRIRGTKPSPLFNQKRQHFMEREFEGLTF